MTVTVTKFVSVLIVSTSWAADTLMLMTIRTTAKRIREAEESMWFLLTLTGRNFGLETKNRKACVRARMFVPRITFPRRPDQTIWRTCVVRNIRVPVVTNTDLG